MPKVFLTEKQRLCHKLASWVYGQMKVHRLTLASVASEMNISHQALSKKLRTESFNYSDFVFFVKKFEPSDRELREIIGI